MLARDWFLKIGFVHNVCVCMCPLPKGIKAGGSELQGQQGAACMYVSRLHNYYCELFTQMAALKF